MMKHCIKRKSAFLLILCLLLGMLIPLSASAASPYTDTENHWSREDVAWAAEQGILLGTSETKFSPDKTVSRAMAITALYRMDGSKGVSGTATFDDVPSDSYYYDAILWGVQNKIINGTSASTFRPDTGVSRQDFAVMLYRYDYYQNGLEWVTPEKPDHYYEPDQGTLTDEEFFIYRNVNNIISWYAKNPMDWAVNESIITGNQNGSIKPLSVMKRGEIAAIVKRYCNREEIGAKRKWVSINPVKVGSIQTTYRMDYEARTITNEDEIKEFMELVNQLEYSYKEPVSAITGSSYLMAVYDHDSKLLCHAEFKGNGLYIGDIYYYMAEDNSAPYSYLPDGWLEKWFQ